MQALNGVQQGIEVRVRGAAGIQQALPVSKEASECVLFNGLDLPAEFGERLSADLPEDFGVAPFAVQSAGAETAFEHPSLDRELTQGILNHRRIESEAIGNLFLRERTVSARITANQFQNRMRDRVDERCRQAGWQWNAEGIAIACSIFDGDQVAFAGN